MKQSLFNVGRKLTPDEWGELKVWRAANPELRWKRGDVRADGRIFSKYASSAKSGEEWFKTHRQYERAVFSKKEKDRVGYEKHRDARLEYSQKYREGNTDAIRARGRRYTAANGVRLRAKAAEYRAARNSDPEALAVWRKYARDYSRERRANDPTYVALTRLRSRHRSLRGSARSRDKEAAAYIAWQVSRLGLGPEDLSMVQVDHVVPLCVALASEEAEEHVMRWENLVVTPIEFNLAKRDALPSYGYLRYRDALVEEYLKVLG